jgi:hypothetical protein
VAAAAASRATRSAAGGVAAPAELRNSRALPPEARGVVERIRELAVPALARMYRPDSGLFAFRLRRDGGRDVLEGTSVRYSAIAALGLLKHDAAAARAALAGGDVPALCERLIAAVQDTRDLGAVALTLWAARACRHPHSGLALQALKAFDPVNGDHSTVELAWCLSALLAGEQTFDQEWLCGALARRLLQAGHRRSGLFAHQAQSRGHVWPRAHVTCFADFVYPVQALARYYHVTRDVDALTAARRCAETMCAMQGPGGQWWWHYDLRTARVIERYPVYAIHQDAMAPMALQELAAVCTFDARAAMARGLAWLARPPETGAGLIDTEAGVVWRKVARREPNKLSRRLQAAASRIHPALRVPGIGRWLRPRAVDYETRPYHMGWFLYAWA